MSMYLLKTEPSEYSLDDLEKEQRCVWSGVSAAPALIHLRAMKKGDSAFLYHTGSEKAVVGTVSIVAAPYPDPAQNDPKLVVVDIAFRSRLCRPVTLAEIKATPSLKQMPLVRIGRLSVMPVTPKEAETILAMSKKAK